MSRPAVPPSENCRGHGTFEVAHTKTHTNDYQATMSGPPPNEGGFFASLKANAVPIALGGLVVAAAGLAYYYTRPAAPTTPRGPMPSGSASAADAGAAGEGEAKKKKKEGKKKKGTDIDKIKLQEILDDVKTGTWLWFPFCAWSGSDCDSRTPSEMAAQFAILVQEMNSTEMSQEDMEGKFSDLAQTVDKAVAQKHGTYLY
jgi:hypothetical protein